jgi:Domain of unknown function (DUF4957)/Domain of unknown function (DUF5123)
MYITGFLAAIFFSGCSDDIASEITSLDVSRLFSPVNLDAKVVNKTSVRLNWNQVTNAKTYVVEFFENGNQDFSGTAMKTIPSVTFDNLPLTVTGFGGETDYSVRVKAVGENISDSKWISATFKTDPEQIFYSVDPAGITANSVTLKWPAGETATSIVLTPGNIMHTVTTAEITAGAALVTGLTGEIAYTAKLMNGTKVRGTATFTTLIDLGGAIKVNPGDDLKTILEAANANDVFALMPGSYAAQDIFVNKSISVKGARPTDKPIITGIIFHIKDGSGLTLKDLILDGTGSLSGNQAVIYDTALLGGTYGAFSMEGCVIKNYTKGTLYVNVAALIESVTIKNCIYYNIECNGGDFIDFRLGMAKTFTYTGNTAYTSALARDFFRMDAGGSTNFPGITSTININNNTFNKVCDGTSRRILYIRLASNQITFTKNIIANTLGYYTNQSATNIVSMSNNNYWNAPNFTASTTSGAKNDTGTYTSLDPGFVSPDTGNFKVTNTTLIENLVGDPRWLK